MIINQNGPPHFQDSRIVHPGWSNVVLPNLHKLNTSKHPSSSDDGFKRLNGESWPQKGSRSMRVLATQETLRSHPSGPQIVLGTTRCQITVRFGIRLGGAHCTAVCSYVSKGSCIHDQQLLLAWMILHA